MKIAIAGLGTIGQAVIRLLEENKSILKKRSGQEFEIVGISARDKSKKRDIDLSAYQWFENPIEMINSTNPDLTFELIGGSEGIAFDVCEAALEQNSHVVTANKALIAMQGETLFKIAKEKEKYLQFEAAVAGGIPIIKALKEGLSANRIDSIYGILNGTCNYILSTMEETKQGFDIVLAEAQEKGFAEADPSFDIDGVDAAQKLAILCSLSFDTNLSFNSIYLEGIRHITAKDIEFASELGYRIRLLAIAEKTDQGIRQRVHPCLIEKTHPIARIKGARNAVVPIGNYVGSSIFEGWGAGGDPTASAVVADMVDIVRHQMMDAKPNYPEFIRQDFLTMDELKTSYYVRLTVIDQPGVLAEITSILKAHDISIESFLQYGRSPEKSVSVVMKTHDVIEKNMQNALQEMSHVSTVIEDPFMIRIETIKADF